MTTLFIALIGFLIGYVVFGHLLTVTIERYKNNRVRKSLGMQKVKVLPWK